ncbi:hypothetical protein ASG76_09385 [Nocardioides sp. Soil774]|uniref:glycosyltransferase 87 family protein n=1 Tax=Nocardioides sp. Soil774 TaxID=1736408 RepID=UPI0006FBBF82|nr:glycosyltransferase 87 family protein [Nocardioides sp. Soil774]KRE94621.1 hypothetical protein ASG76_09385 [Nocardioides sp. Soil774]
MEFDLPKRLALVTLCLTLAAVGLIETRVHLSLTGPGWDAWAYWDAWRGAMYDGSVGDSGQFLYSPAFAQAIWPLAQTTWPLFAWVFILLNAVGLAWLLKPLPPMLAVPLWLAGSQEVLSGNVFIPMAVVAVLGMPRSYLWAFVALTKITPCLGPIWFAARGEWRAVARAVAATVCLASASALLAPGLWLDWFAFLVDQARLSDTAVGYPFIPGPIFRLPVAVLLVVWAARPGRTWTLPVAMVIATPFIWNGSFTLLAAIPRLREYDSSAARPGRADGPRAPPPSSTSAPTG